MELDKSNVADKLNDINSTLAFLEHAAASFLCNEEGRPCDNIVGGMKCVFSAVQAELTVITDYIQEHAVFNENPQAATRK